MTCLHTTSFFSGYCPSCYYYLIPYLTILSNLLFITRTTEKKLSAIQFKLLFAPPIVSISHMVGVIFSHVVRTISQRLFFLLTMTVSALLNQASSLKRENRRELSYTFLTLSNLHLSCSAQCSRKYARQYLNTS